jgi:flagellar protein FliO/FliZ
MDIVQLLRAIGALLLVLALLGGCAILLRRHGHRLTSLGLATSGDSPRLAIIETRSIDAKSRLVLVRWDRSEHLILVTPAQANVIESRQPEPQP